ncbi:TetR/AcrR family transcriptional regulator [uncultured Gemmiger sp.]|uniref:TetR/AcrR family transcriptional regulator n=1 Tax=uncultured Gemmiger sp. TaxID=1623490 RepID=UPI0025FE35F3|nr:TetR/AcrR family transcriptional regulator [uncultured Gemmiger sp.]
MADKHTDLRVLKTQESIRRAYLELLQTHQAKEITVTQICRRARINRGTFYLHYQDTQALLDAIVGDLVDELAVVIHKYPPRELKDNPFPVIYEAFSTFARHADFLPFLQENGSPEFLDRLKALLNEMLLTEWLPMHSEQKQEDYPYINAFIVSGTIEVFKVWVQGGMQKSARDLATLIERLALEGIR